MYWIFIFIFILLIFHNHGIPIFLYHQIHPGSKVNPELLEQHLLWLSQKGYHTMTLSEYIGEGAPKKTVLLTLDDGYYDNYKYVFPLLKKYNMKATIFLNTLYISEDRKQEEEIQENGIANQKAILQYVETGCGESAQYMTWREIREMYESGLVDFQAHSHKHMAVFADNKLQGFFQGTEEDCTDTYLYRGRVKEGYPKFRKRGEYTLPGFQIQEEFFPIFEEYYHRVLKVIENEKKRREEGQKFIEKHSEYFHKVTEQEFEIRITEDYLENKRQIEAHLGNEVSCFCWPWGHRSWSGVSILEKLGVRAFVTTKKGSNDQLPNLKVIKRIELRNYNLRKFKWNVWIASNLILGKIYSLVS
ncbi:MAG: polysaccharide deacetylase family protein [Fusobacterium necrophorum]|nr:polysaccharide deacetylase family protein [Fusobacterium necrophorum]